MTQCTIVQVNNVLAVQSPYHSGFAYHARNVGGTWDKTEKLWKFALALDVVQSLCQRYYGDAVVVADALPVPEVKADAGFYSVVGALARVTVTVERAHNFMGAYGLTRIYTMRDASGQLFTWFCTGSANWEIGTTLTIEGKIKKHETYKGISQTVLTRCKKVS